MITCTRCARLTRSCLVILLLLQGARLDAAVSVSGRVFNKATGAPIIRATVSLYTDPPPTARTPGPGHPAPARPGSPVAITQTLTNGSFILRAPGAGAYWANIRPDSQGGDYEAYDEPVTLSASGQPLQLAVKPRRVVRLRLQAPGGQPVTGPVQAWEWVLWGDHQAAVRQVTREASADGVVELPPPPDVRLGEVKKALVEVRSAGCGCAAIRLEGWPEETRPLLLKPGATLAGLVLDEQGKPVPESRMAIYRTTGESSMPMQGSIEAKTTAAGRFEVPALLPGGYFVRAEHSPRGRAFYHAVTVKGERTDTQLKPEATPISTTMWDEVLPRIEHFPVPYSQVAMVVDPEAARSLLAVSGHVLDGDTHAPVPGIFIFLEPQHGGGELADVAATRPDGSFTVRAVAPGTYSVTAQSDSYAFSRQNVELPAAGRAPLELSLNRSPVVNIKLVTNDGKPAPPGPVQLFAVVDSDNGQRSSARDATQVGPGGAVELKFPPYNDISHGPNTRLLVTAVSPTLGMAQTTVEHWSKEAITVQFKPGWKLSGQVLDGVGHPLLGITLNLGQWRRQDISSQAALNSLGEAHSDGQGRFEVAVIPHMTCSIEWTLPGGTSQAAIITISHPDTPVVLTPFHLLGGVETAVKSAWQLEQTLGSLLPLPGGEPSWSGAAAPVAGRVRASVSHQPLQDALVMLFSPEDTAPVAVARPTAEGAFTLTAPGSGQYHLAVASGGYVAQDIPVEVHPGGVKGLSLEAPEDPSLRLAVADASGKAMPGGQAQLWIEGEGATEPLPGVFATSSISPTGMTRFQPRFGGPLDSLTALQLWLRVDAVGCAHVVLDHWPAGPAPIRLHAGSSLQGEVVDGSGKSLPHVRVSAARLRPDGAQFLEQERVTDTHGRFTIHNLFPAIYRVEAGSTHPDRDGRGNEANSVQPWRRTVLLPHIGLIKLVLSAGK